jgi:hypothetical protein
VFKDGINTFHNLDVIDLRYMLRICTQESHFQFNGEYYDQINGVAMGSPLCPLCANFFMANFEKKWLNEMKQKGLKLRKTYVDEVFATFNSQEESVSVLTRHNSKHLNIKFTLEKENSNQPPFLNITVVRTRMKFITTLYRKKPFTGVYINWTSLTSRKYKIGLIQCILDRVWKICNKEKERHEEVRKMRLILEKNEYLTHIVNKEIERFV